MIVQKLPSSASPGKGQEDPASVQSQRSKLARVDFLGGGLLAAATVAFVLALDLGGQNVPWDAPLIVILSVSALVLGGLFLVVEGYWAKEPVFPIRLLVHRDVVTSYLIAGLQVAAGIGVLFSVPWYFQVTANASAVAAGAYLIPAVVGNAAGSVFTGLMIRRTGRYKSLILLGPAISAIGYLLLILRWRGRTNLAELMYIIVGEFGNAISQSSGIIGLMAGVESLDIAVAGTGFAQSQSIGVIVGLTLNMATLQSSLRPMLTRHLQDVPNRQSIIDQATSNIEYVKGLTGGLREVVVTSYVTSLMYTHVLSLTFSVLAFGVALFVKEYKL
ncbi:hypothetical protein MMC30_005969 [Trapelia coarctata]|nr:hypothetical protein [Trapelia coarctata]